MGAYASQPVTECHSIDNENARVRFGASSMQGWRRTQEDALNCCHNFDDETETMLFAVYDGHGGAEVAEYCGKVLPSFIKSLPAYKDGSLEKCLKEAFVDFDATLLNDEVVEKLKLLANRPESPLPPNVLRLRKGLLNDGESDEDDDDDFEENGEHDEDETAALLEDACTPIEQVLKKLTNGEFSGNDTNCKENNDKDSLHTQSHSSKAQDEAQPSSSRETANTSQEPSNSKETPNASQESDNQQDKDSSEAGGSGLSNSLPKPTDTTKQDVDYEDTSSSEDGDTSEPDEDDSDDDDDEMQISQEMALKFTESEDYLNLPGSDSGCTACLVLIRENRIYVANAGDSRCVLSRSGKAKDLSVDHKPEDELEKQRIEKAGGFVSPDGRVNGNLNLSRAIGDHNYKRNKEIELSEQMITALPDIQVETLTTDDEFVIVACDGIWNSLSSQECVEFVKLRLERGDKPSSICEDLFHSILADNTMEGDGTGCDNMTCIIIDLQKSKRPDIKNERTSSTGFDHTTEEDCPVSPHPDEPPNKIQKCT